MPAFTRPFAIVLLGALMSTNVAGTAGAGGNNGSAVHATAPKIIRGASGSAQRRLDLRQYGSMPFNQIVARLTRAGYAEIRPVKRARGYWSIEAIRNNGAVHRLRVAQHDGRIISRSRTGWTRVPVPGRHANR